MPIIKAPVAAGGGGAWEYVNTYEVTADDTITISGLDLDADEEYYIDYEYTNFGMGGYGLRVYQQSENSNNYAYSKQTNNSFVINSSYYGGFPLSTYSSNTNYIHGSLRIKRIVHDSYNKHVLYDSEAANITSQTTYEKYKAWGRAYTTNNLTSLTFVGSVDGDIIIHLYKLKTS